MSAEHTPERGVKYPTLDEAVAAKPRELIPSDGHTTSLWHRQHEHYMEHVVPHLPRCAICGGIGHRREPTHALCRERAKRLLPIKELNTIAKCGCARCAAALRGEVKP